jgi:hypothetical protein
MNTQLNITIPKETDCRFMSIWDRSLYNPDLPVSEALYNITPPGWNYPRNFYYEPNKVFTVNSSLLGLTTETNFAKMPPLPDGVYVIKQQICPHDKLFAEYYHFRTCRLQDSLNKLLCKIKSPCEITRKEMSALQNDYLDAQFYLDVAVASAESCGNIEKAQLFYDKAKEIIKDISNDCNCK